MLKELEKLLARLEATLQRQLALVESTRKQIDGVTSAIAQVKLQEAVPPTAQREKGK